MKDNKVSKFLKAMSSITHTDITSENLMWFVVLTIATATLVTKRIGHDLSMLQWVVLMLAPLQMSGSFSVFITREVYLPLSSKVMALITASIVYGMAFIVNPYHVVLMVGAKFIIDFTVGLIVNFIISFMRNM